MPNIENQVRDDEIDLRELFFTLAQGKWIILSVTLGFVFVSAIASLFVIKPVYESAAVVAPASVSTISTPNYGFWINDSDGQVILDKNKISTNIDQNITIPQIDINSFKEILTSENVLKQANQKLSLGETISKGNITVEQKKDGSKAVYISVKANDPKNAAIFANTLINEAINKMNKLNDEKMQDLSQNLNIQLNAAEQDLNSAYNNMKQYQQNHYTASDKISTDIEQKRLDDDIKSKQNVVDALRAKILEVKLAQTLNAAEDKIIILSPAEPINSPVSPNKMLNITLAGIVGLMFSVIAVFLIDFLKGFSRYPIKVNSDKEG